MTERTQKCRAKHQRVATGESLPKTDKNKSNLMSNVQYAVWPVTILFRDNEGDTNWC